MCSLGVWGYQEAVRTLNTLQTNAGYLEQVKRQRGDPQTQLEAMERYLARSGLQVSRVGPGGADIWGRAGAAHHSALRAEFRTSLLCPLQVEDLDQLNIIHVTGTKGKVRCGTQGERVSWGAGRACPDKAYFARALLVPSLNEFSGTMA